MTSSEVGDVTLMGLTKDCQILPPLAKSWGLMTHVHSCLTVAEKTLKPFQVKTLNFIVTYGDSHFFIKFTMLGAA